MDMELLVDRLNTLVNADVSRDEVLRQLNQKKPDLGRGDVLSKARVLVNQSEDINRRRGAHDYLEDILPLTNSYKTSTGPLGSTYDEVTVWDQAKKPLPFAGLITFIFSILIGGLVYWLGFPNTSPFIIMIGIVLAFIVSMEVAVANNKYRARRELDDKILRSAESFESMLNNMERS